MEFPSHVAGDGTLGIGVRVKYDIGTISDFGIYIFWIEKESNSLNQTEKKIQVHQAAQICKPSVARL